MTSLERIAKASGNSVQTIRLLMQQEYCCFGTVVKKGEKFTYILYPEKVKELFGIDLGKEKGE